MSVPGIELAQEGGYRPYEIVRGRVRGARLCGELRLFWKTHGRGSEELEVCAIRAVEGEGTFEMSLPGDPYSVDGRLVSILWGLEWLDPEGRPLAFRELVVSPTREPIQLSTVEEPRSEKRILKSWFRKYFPGS
ncbi:MAG: hypothetical protein ACQKBU_06720 [Verrucomicrobiales bacterium]